jgi:hypothetical protein
VPIGRDSRSGISTQPLKACACAGETRVMFVKEG